MGIGQAVLAAEPARLTTILGSCIALTLYSPQPRLGMLSHVVLPHATGPATYPAKFADTAVPHMLATLKDHGAKVKGLVGQDHRRRLHVRRREIHADRRSERPSGDGGTGRRRRPLVGQDVGGTIGRRICFDLATGSITVECIGHPSHTI